MELSAISTRIGRARHLSFTESNRHEVVSLKKVIRIISHEINNSLGPISSLIGSERAVAPLRLSLW
jgi:hypothetical protein